MKNRILALFLVTFLCASGAWAETVLRVESRVFVVPDFSGPNGPGQGGTRDVQAQAKVRLEIAALDSSDVGKEVVAQAFLFEYYSLTPCGGPLAIIEQCTSRFPAGGAGQVQACLAPQFGLSIRSCDDSWKGFGVGNIGAGPGNGEFDETLCATQLCIDCI